MLLLSQVRSRDPAAISPEPALLNRLPHLARLLLLVLLIQHPRRPAKHGAQIGRQVLIYVRRIQLIWIHRLRAAQAQTRRDLVIWLGPRQSPRKPRRRLLIEGLGRTYPAGISRPCSLVVRLCALIGRRVISSRLLIERACVLVGRIQATEGRASKSATSPERRARALIGRVQIPLRRLLGIAQNAARSINVGL